MKLAPTLWRTCRIIANETRLQLLWEIFNEEELCVSQLVEKTGITRPNASNQLRALSARGLITSRRKKLYVFYRAEANAEIAYAPLLLSALKKCHRQSMPFDMVIRQATALTHERRIEIVRALNGHFMPFNRLRDRTRISAPALSRHLEKLEARGFIRGSDDCYRLIQPENSLGRTLLEIVRR